MIIEEPLPLPPFSLPVQQGEVSPLDPAEERYRKMPLKDLVQEMNRAATDLVKTTPAPRQPAGLQ